ncbi:MAG: hypothetical protein ACE5KT_00555 [Methanosarcinales archaeon]
MMKENQTLGILTMVAVIALSIVYYLSLSSMLFTNSRDSSETTQIGGTTQKAPVYSYYPANKTPSIKAGSSLVFFVIANNTNGTTPSYKWTLDGVEKSNSDTWIYTPHYSENGTKMVELTLKDKFSTHTRRWTVNVITKQKPQPGGTTQIGGTTQKAPVYSYYPANKTPSIKAGSSLVFFVIANNTNGTTPSYKWTLDGVEKSNSDTWIYTPHYSENGTKMVELTLKDKFSTHTRRWTVTVTTDSGGKTQKAPVYSFHPANKTPSIHGGSSLVFFVIANNINGKTPSYKWTLDGVEKSNSDTWIYTPQYSENVTTNPKLQPIL